MKKIKNIYKTIAVLLLIVACTDNDLRDLSFLDTMEPPSNLELVFSITQDNTGTVTITPNADGAHHFDVFLGDSTPDSQAVSQGNNLVHIYSEGTYDVKIIAYNTKGDVAELTKQLIVSFRAPENLVATIENDAAISKQLNVNATADFATMYEFHSGETGVTQPVASANIGEALSYQYTDSGTYTVKVVAKGGAIATSEYTIDFEVTAILAPVVSAEAPPARNDSDVISIYSNSYTNVSGTDTFPDWGQGGQGSSWGSIDLNGDQILQYTNLSYQGINFGSAQDVSSMEYIHLDVWTADVDRIETSLISVSNGEKPVWANLTPNVWNSIDIPIAAFTDQGLTVADIYQLKFVGDAWAAGTAFIDNIYFYKEPSSTSNFDDGLLNNGDFESGSESWLIGVDDSSSAPVVSNNGNTHYSVDVTNAGNPWDVNTSQKVEIIDGTSYTLTFDAWGSNRSLVAGIGLSGGPWNSSTSNVDITSVRTTYSITVSAEGWGAADARVLFDLGAAAGLVNIDNVSLFVGNGNLVTNGNFENGSDSWLVGVDDSSAAPVVETNGNSHYQVDVVNAGNPWDVNTSQKLEIIDGNTYTLMFDAWGSDRSLVAGIGLSGGPWNSSTSNVDITSVRATYSITVSADGWGAADARVLFDLGAAAGLVNIDNVSLSIN